MRQHTVTPTAASHHQIDGRSYSPFPERRQMTVCSNIRPGMAISPGQIVWACGQDGSVYAIAMTKKGAPNLFVAPQFLGGTEDS